MTPEELRDLFRSDVEDTDELDPLWSETEVYQYMDQAQKYFARETDYFTDVSTAAIVNAAVTAADPFVTIDPRITKLRGARLSDGTKVTPVKYDDIDRVGYARDAYDTMQFSNNINWESDTGVPRFAITDMEDDKLRLVPIPTANDTLNLRVYRLPLEDITEDCNTSFEITEYEYQRGLMYYMKYLAYQKNDSDVYNAELAAEALSQWGDFIGRVRRALDRKRFGSTTGVVRYGGL